MASVRKMRGVSRCGVCPAAATISRRAPGIACGDGLGARAAGRIEGAGDDEGRGADAGEPVVKRLHGALAGAPQARGEPGRTVAQAVGMKPGRRGRRHGGVAREDGLAFPFVDEGLDPVALEPGGTRLVGGDPGGPFGRVGDAGGRAFEDEPPD